MSSGFRDGPRGGGRFGGPGGDRPRDFEGRGPREDGMGDEGGGDDMGEEN
jgi:hypothetical protein